MARKKTIEWFSADEAKAKVQRGESGTNWAKAGAMTSEQLEASIAADPDEADMVVDWEHASVELPQPKAVLNMRVDRDVLDFFKRTGRGYQTRINAVLKAFVEAQQHRGQ